MKGSIQKYSKNLSIVRQSEEFLDSNQKQIFSINPDSNFSVGRIKVPNTKIFPNYPILDNFRIHLFKMFYLIVCLLIRSVKIDFSQKNNPKFSKNNIGFESLNKNIKKQKTFCDLNIIKTLKVLSLFHFVLTMFGSKSSMSTIFNSSLLWFLFLCILENFLFKTKICLENTLNLNINFLQRVIGYSEPDSENILNFQSVPEHLKTQKVISESKKFIHELRIYQNLKKNFVTNFFLKNGNILREKENQKSGNIKIVSGHWNEKMMRKENGKYQYVTDEELKGFHFF